MKHKIKSALSLLLSLAMVVTGLTVTPVVPNVALIADAAESKVFIDTDIRLYDTGTTDLSNVLHWRGETVTLAVGVFNAYQKSLSWTVSAPEGKSAEDIQLGETDDTESKRTNLGSGFDIKQKFIIGNNASGIYTITAQVEGVDSKTYQLKVEESDLSEILSTNYSAFDTLTRWTKEEIDLYVVTSKDVENVSFTSSNPELVELKQTDTSNANLMPYYGAGSKVHKWTAYVGDTVSEETKVTITAQCGDATKTLQITINQAASSIITDSIQVSCNDLSDGHSHTSVTHTNGDKSVIYMDRESTVIITGEIAGSTSDPVYVTSSKNGQCEIHSASVAKKDGSGMCFVITVEGKNSTPNGTPDSFDISTDSGQVTTKTMQVVIYDAKFKEEGFKCYYQPQSGKSVELNPSGIAVDEGLEGTFSTNIADPKEKVKWTLAGKNVIELDENTGKYKAVAAGTGKVTATVMETNSGKRGQSFTFDVSVQGIVAPDALEIWDSEGKQKAGSTILYVGDEPTTFTRKALLDGKEDGIHYSDYEWVVSPDDGTVKVTSLDNGKVQVEPVKKGKVEFYTKTKTNVFSQRMELSVIAPIKSVSIQYAGNNISDLETIEDRIYELTAVRDKDASVGENAEYFNWEISDETKAVFVDEEGKDCGKTFEGSDTCRVRTTKEGMIGITARATGLNARSKASATCNFNIKKEVNADYVKISPDDQEALQLKDNEIGSSSENPYILDINQNKTHTFSITGYALGGQISNDEFDGKYVLRDMSVATVVWKEVSKSFEVNPKKAGTVDLIFKDVQTGREFNYYVEIVVPATSITILDGNNIEKTDVVRKVDDTFRLYAKVLPTDSTDTVTWKSSNPDAVEVDEKTGQVTVKGKTENPETPVTITASANENVSQTCMVYVVEPIESIEVEALKDGKKLKLDGTDVIYIGDTVTVSGVKKPEGATDSFDWATNNANVAYLADNGDGTCVITAKGQGTATISATPRLQNATDGVTSFMITVAKEPSEMNVRLGRNTGELVGNSTIDLDKDITLVAVLDPVDSYDLVTWTASEEDVVNLTVTNKQSTHNCVVKRLEQGKTITLTASTSNGKKQDITLRTGISLKDCTIDPIPSRKYDGTKYQPQIVLKDKEGNELRLGTDYTVTYPNNVIVAGEKQVTVKGKGLYCDEITADYSIEPLDLSTAVIAQIKDQIYSGKEITPAVVVTNENKKLGTADYTVTYADNLNAGTAKITLTGQGNYTGTAAATFVITPKDMGKIGAAFKNGNSFDYTGSAITPAMTVTDGKTEMKQGTDYTISYTNNVNVGTNTAKPTVVITGIGNYGGTKEVVFTIKKAKLAADCITLSKTDYTYNGKNCKPKVTVKDANGRTLKENTDYTVVYPTDLKSIGKKKITVTGTGNYEGRADAEYGVAEKVTVKKAAIKSVKNTKSKKATVTIKALADVDGYEISYSTSKKFTAATTKTVNAATNKQTITKLKKGKTYYFRVRAYKENSIGRTIYGKASAIKKVKIKK